MYYVYILKLSNGQLYTGFTSDIERRLGEHRSGKVVSTKYRIPLELIHFEAYVLKSDALRRERFLKNNRRKTVIADANTRYSGKEGMMVKYSPTRDCIE